jgi:hypothetical protein
MRRERKREPRTEEGEEDGGGERNAAPLISGQRR